MSNINLNISFEHPGATSHTIRYARIDNANSPSFTTFTGVTTSPLNVQNVPNGQYRIGIKPVYADNRPCEETIYDTPACTGITSLSAILNMGVFVISYTALPSVPYIQVNIQYPNGGAFTNQYLNTGSDINITPPSGVYGSYTITISPVCDTSSNFIGTASAPVIVNIPNPPNSTFTNNDSTALAPVNLTSFTTGSQSVFTSSSVAASGGIVAFYLADGTYNSLVISFGSGSPTASSLVTGSGTYNGVVSGNTITFTNVTVVSGVTITVT